MLQNVVQHKSVSENALVAWQDVAELVAGLKTLEDVLEGIAQIDFTPDHEAEVVDQELEPPFIPFILLYREFESLVIDFAERLEMLDRYQRTSLEQR